MNRYQLANVATGMMIFLVGALVGVRALAGGPGRAPSAALPGALVLAAVLVALGVMVALLGAYLTRDRG